MIGQFAVKPHSHRTVHEYGNSKHLLTIAKELESPLRSCFPSHYRDVMAFGMLKNLGPVPIKLMKAKWEKLHASTEMDAHLSPNTVSSTLKIIGSDYDSQRKLFTNLLSGSRYLVFDLSSIFTRSENTRLAEKGHNPKHLHIRQIKMAMLFSHERRMPAVLKPVPGSVRDPKVFRSLAKEYPLKKLIVIADRGSSPGTVKASGGWIHHTPEVEFHADRLSPCGGEKLLLQWQADKCLQEKNGGRIPVHVRGYDSQI